MGKVFEDYFSELQADMVSICLEYVNDKADYIFIDCSNEDGAISSNFFYRINGKIVERHKLNSVLPEDTELKYDTSVARQKAAIDVIDDDIKKIMELCREYERPIPARMQIVYNVKTSRCNVDYQYDYVYSNEEDKTFYEVTKEWFSEIQMNPGKYMTDQCHYVY